jgi:hypothetical protein
LRLTRAILSMPKIKIIISNQAGSKDRVNNFPRNH